MNDIIHDLHKTKNSLMLFIIERYICKIELQHGSVNEYLGHTVYLH